MRWVVVIAVLAEAGFMVVDGVRALVVGDYFTPSSGDHAGQLGPWADVVGRVGLDPRSNAMKWIFVVYGAVWLGVIPAFVAQWAWAWWAMVVVAVGSLWYLVPGTVISAIVVVGLLLPGVRSVYLA
jgi:hypothetical protein